MQRGDVLTAQDLVPVGLAADGARLSCRGSCDKHPGPEGEARAMLSEKLKTRIEHQVDTRSVTFGAWLYRRTGGRMVHLWHRRALILTATGRRSGLPRTVIVQFFPDGQDMIVVAANSGLPTHPGWYFNLKAHPEARVEVEGRTLQVRAEELSPDQAAAFWPRVLDAAPDYAKYRRRTTRVIPLLRLIPVGGSAVAS